MDGVLVVAIVVKHAVSRVNTNLTKTLTNGGTIGLAIRNISVPANSAIYALEKQGLPINLNDLEAEKHSGQRRRLVRRSAKSLCSYSGEQEFMVETGCFRRCKPK